MSPDLKRPSQPGVSPSSADPAKPDPATSQPFPVAQRDSTGRPSPPRQTSLKKDGVALKDKAMDRLAAEADSRKGEVSKQLKSVSGALHAAEDELSNKGDAADWLKSGLHQVVTTIEDLAERVANKDSAELIGEVKSFARENPKTFLAACAAVGFAAARVLKAGGSEDSPQGVTPTTGGRS